MSRKARVACYCTCGDTMVGEVWPPEHVARLESIFDQVHTGEGHARTDARTARNARRRADRAR